MDKTACARKLPDPHLWSLKQPLRSSAYSFFLCILDDLNRVHASFTPPSRVRRGWCPGAHAHGAYLSFDGHPGYPIPPSVRECREARRPWNNCPAILSYKILLSKDTIAQRRWDEGRDASLLSYLITHNTFLHSNMLTLSQRTTIGSTIGLMYIISSIVFLYPRRMDPLPSLRCGTWFWRQQSHWQYL